MIRLGVDGKTCPYSSKIVDNWIVFRGGFSEYQKMRQTTNKRQASFFGLSKENRLRVKVGSTQSARNTKSSSTKLVQQARIQDDVNGASLRNNDEQFGVKLRKNLRVSCDETTTNQQPSTISYSADFKYKTRIPIIGNRIKSDERRRINVPTALKFLATTSNGSTVKLQEATNGEEVVENLRKEIYSLQFELEMKIGEVRSLRAENNRLQLENATLVDYNEKIQNELQLKKSDCDEYATILFKKKKYESKLRENFESLETTCKKERQRAEAFRFYNEQLRYHLLQLPVDCSDVANASSSSYKTHNAANSLKCHTDFEDLCRGLQFERTPQSNGIEDTNKSSRKRKSLTQGEDQICKRRNVER